MFLVRVKKTVILALFAVTAALVSTDDAYGYSHNMIQTTRSSMSRNVFVTQAVEAEYGTYSSVGSDGGIVRRTWSGYGFRNAVGLELMKFIHFSANHTFLNMASKDSSSDRLGGSRLAGEVKFSFASPLGNLEMGAGAIVSRYDLQRQLNHTSTYGSGMYYTVGVNYFLSSQVSVFGTMRNIEESFARNAGASLDGRVGAKTTSAGIGASIWL